MTTFTPNATKVVDALSTTSFSNDRLFDYDATWEQARKGSKAAIIAIIGEFTTRMGYIKPGNTKLNGYGHFINRTNLRKAVNNYREMIDLLQKVLNKQAPLSSLDLIKNNHALVQPHFDSFTKLDIEMVHIGMSRNGSKGKYRGMENYSHLPNYATFSAHEQGILVTLNGKQHIISTETAYALIATPLLQDLEAKEAIKSLRDGGNETPEAIEALEENFCHYQRVPYTQGGVFPTNGNSISYDGCTMIIAEGTEFLTTDGEVITLETTRLSMEHWLFTVITAPVAQIRGLSKTSKFQYHAQLATELFGANIIPCNATELRQLWDFGVALIQGENDNYRLHTQKEIDARFLPGSYLARRHFTCPDDIRNIDTYMAGIAAYEQDQINQQAEALAKREARKQNNIEESLITEDEHPFA